MNIGFFDDVEALINKPKRKTIGAVKLHKHIESFTERERRVYEFLYQGFANAVADLRNLSHKDKEDRDPTREVRVDDRINNFAFTARELGLDFNYIRDEDFKVIVTLWS